MKPKFLFLLLIILNASLISTSAQNEPKKQKKPGDDAAAGVVRLFESDEILNIKLRFDISAYKKNRSDTSELDALLTYYLSQTDSVEKKIRIRARGNMRRSYCDMPPIRLNFKESRSLHDEFVNIDKIKMVTQCKVGSEETLLREYLCYKLFNQLSDNSFRVRLARVTYINTARKNKSQVEYAFLIEPTDILCKRLGMIEIKDVKTSQKVMKYDMMDRLAIFNYMIGNTDWSVPIFHNVLVMKQNVLPLTDMLSIIPFDFDQAGLVDAEYAAPFEGLGIKSVKERRYLGICRDEATFTAALKEFADKKEDFYRTINEFPYLSNRVKKEMIIYLEGFYDGFDKRNSIIYKLQKDCINF